MNNPLKLFTNFNFNSYAPYGALHIPKTYWQYLECMKSYKFIPITEEQWILKQREKNYYDPATVVTKTSLRLCS